MKIQPNQNDSGVTLNLNPAEALSLAMRIVEQVEEYQGHGVGYVSKAAIVNDGKRDFPGTFNISVSA
jgi:hypothetical protein